MSSAPRVGVVVAPRWAGNAQSDWYVPLQEKVFEKFGKDDVELEVVDFPEHNPPVVEDEDAFLRGILGEKKLKWSERGVKNVVLVGHSVGNQALMRLLADPSSSEVLPTGSIAACVFVAGWFAVDKPWDSLLPWLEDFDTGKTKTRLSERDRDIPITLIQSDNDPFTSDFNANERDFREKVGATDVLTVSGAKHFNGADEPEVFKVILAAIQTALDA
jgi:serine hydrolase